MTTPEFITTLLSLGFEAVPDGTFQKTYLPSKHIPEERRVQIRLYPESNSAWLSFWNEVTNSWLGSPRPFPNAYIISHLHKHFERRS
jgi:hypothetical protein